MTTAIRVLKEQQLIQIENFYHVKRFLDRFSKKVLAFMTTQDQEMNLLKNKTQRDMQILDRQIDEKIRQNQKSVMEHVESMGLRYDAIIDKQSQSVRAAVAKLEYIEPTKTTLEVVDKNAEALKNELIYRIEQV